MEKPYLDSLEEEAERSGLTPNALLNQILKQWSLFGRHAARIQCMITSQATVSALIETLSEDYLRDLGTLRGRSFAQAFSSIYGLAKGVDAFIFLVSELGVCAGLYQTHETMKGKKLFMRLFHTLGMKWSAFLYGGVRAIATESLGREITCNSHCDGLTLVIDLEPAALPLERATIAPKVYSTSKQGTR